ncbi:uncharacterized protein LOC112517311 isoform X1 [Cynara cardunculus var. scolymus]|uniref:uncharacterized protein LOC112517311 isoform X1 n=1 Tax=Cynara cardunculus var. scolymus TaxID=59895 RepID=UPI000D62F99E|nr:uncharacterized protein LOC112517311 isoform X1 [Cynara cardunculus var. scolymus]XP_024980474.1 uncharacterized protein LOC112517311 isoform X1 [Cynara cardunculus var. scolymus]
MERSEPTFVPEWLKSSGGLSTTSHQLQSSSLHSDEQGVSKATRNKSFVNISDNELGRPSVSDRTTSSYFRRTSSNGSSHLRSYSSFGRNHRDRDWDKDIHEFREKEKPDGRLRDYSDPLGNILPSRFEKEGLRRSHSSVSAKRGESWPRKVVVDSSSANKNSHNNGSALRSGAGAIGSVKTAFERDFPSLGAEEKQIDPEIGRVPSPGLTTAIQSLPIGNSAVIGGDGWTSALAEVPVIVGSNGSNTSVPPPLQSTSISATASMATGRNMAETLAQGPPRAQTAPQLSVGTQRLEELAVKQSRQLIPMTPSLPKALALNSSDKPKSKVGQLQLQSSHLVNHTHSPRPVSTKFDVSKTSSVGKLHVLKPSRERNGITPIAKDNLSPTGASKLPNSPLAVTSVVGSAPLRNLGNNPAVAVAVKPGVAATLEKRPSSQAQSRNDFFNLMRKKSMTNNSSPVTPDTGSSISAGDKPTATEGGIDPAVVDGSGGVQVSSGNKVDLSSCNGEATERSNGKNNSSSDAIILYSEEEEARFLRSLGWEETGEEEEGLTEEEISSFYRDVSKYLNLQAASKIFKPKLLMPRMGNNGDISSDSKLES